MKYNDMKDFMNLLAGVAIITSGVVEKKGKELAATVKYIPKTISNKLTIIK